MYSSFRSVTHLDIDTLISILYHVVDTCDVYFVRGPVYYTLICRLYERANEHWSGLDLTAS